MDSNSLQDLQQIFEYELKRKLTERAKSSSEEIRILLNSFKFFDLNYSGIIDKNRWIQGIFRTGLSGFSESDLDSLFSVYDKNNSGQIDYKNFCSFIYGREQLNPLTNQSLKINDNVTANNMNQISQNQENQNSNMNININQINQDQNINSNNDQMNQVNQYQENVELNMNNNSQYNNRLQNSQIRNYNEGINTSNNINNAQERKKTPLYNNIQITDNNCDNVRNIQRNQINYNNNQNNNNYLNNKKTPVKDYNEYEYNNNFRHTQRNINSYNNTFNNIFQQESSSSNQNTYDESNASYNNISENKLNSVISSIKSCILTNNGITLFTFMKKLKDKQLNYKGISIEDLNNIFQDMRVNISLNDLKILFNVLNQNSNQNNGTISFGQLINLIEGNLQERRKLYIVGMFANIDTEKKGEVSIQALKNMYNAKYHPDVLNGTKSQEDAFEQFCYSLDLYCEANGIQPNGNLTFENFIDYYSGISACIPDDVYFEDMLNGVWNNNNSLNNISYNDVNANNNINNNSTLNEKNEFDNYGMNSILMGISPNDRNKKNNNNTYNNNNYNQKKSGIRVNNNYNDSISNIIQNNNNNSQINQFNNNSFSRRLKNSASSPFIPDKNINNKQNNILNDNNNNLNNYSNKQSPSFLSNTIPLSQKVSTPFRQSGRNQEGIKVYQKRRYNPITDEYYNDFEINSNNDKGSDNIISDNDNYSAIQNSPSNISNNLIQNNNYINGNSNGIIDQLRNILISRGSKSIFNFQRMLSIYDRNHSGQISPDDFTTIFQTYNLDFSSSDIQNICQQFDTNQTGTINYDLLMNNLIGQMNDKRRLSVQKVFDNFNKNEQGEVLLSEIKQKYNSGRHPEVVRGRKRREEEFGEFLDKLEIFREYNDNLKMSYSTTMNFNEFLRFYSEISMSIKDDNLFDNILYNCWNVNSGFEDRNINYYNNNSNNNNNNDRNYGINIRARTGKQIMNRNNMPY